MACGVALSHDINCLYTGGFEVTQATLGNKSLMQRLRERREGLIYVSSTVLLCVGQIWYHNSWYKVGPNRHISLPISSADIHLLWMYQYVLVSAFMFSVF